MKHKLNHQRALLWAGLAGLAAMFGIATHRAADAEDRHNDASCSPLTHQNPCEHKTVRNPGMCFTNVPLCSGTTNPNLCSSSEIAYYDVKDDFPQGETDDPTTICRQTQGGSAEYTIWNAHHNVISPAADCYRRVVCKWDTSTSPAKCVVDYEISPWISIAKPTAVKCD